MIDGQLIRRGSILTPLALMLPTATAPDPQMPSASGERKPVDRRVLLELYRLCIGQCEGIFAGGNAHRR
jgi:hypothetical protein